MLSPTSIVLNTSKLGGLGQFMGWFKFVFMVAVVFTAGFLLGVILS